MCNKKLWCGGPRDDENYRPFGKDPETDTFPEGDDDDLPF